MASNLILLQQIQQFGTEDCKVELQKSIKSTLLDIRYCLKVYLCSVPKRLVSEVAETSAKVSVPCSPLSQYDITTTFALNQVRIRSCKYFVRTRQLLLFSRLRADNVYHSENSEIDHKHAKTWCQQRCKRLLSRHQSFLQKAYLRGWHMGTSKQTVTFFSAMAFSKVTLLLPSCCHVGTAVAVFSDFILHH